MTIPLDRILSLNSDQLRQVVWSLQDTVALACILEAASPKLGNVHPDACFDDMTFDTFVTSANVIAATLTLPMEPLGARCLSSAKAMRATTNTNPHLGTLLLLAPLVMAAENLTAQDQRNAKELQPSCDAVQIPARCIDTVNLQQETNTVLKSLTAQDAQDVYSAIRAAKPGGLGQSDEHDVNSSPPASLLEAMSLASDRDLVARQYTSGFEDIFQSLVPMLHGELADNTPLDAISRFQIHALAWQPDSLIARKCGLDTAIEIQNAATKLAAQISVDSSIQPSNLPEWQRLDQEMRREGNRLNPGTIADLIAASLFVSLVTTK